MDRALALVLIGLVFGGGIGFVVAAGAGVTLDGHDHAAHGDATGIQGAHDHGAPLVLADADAPAVELALTEDPVAGWNLHAMTSNFRFAPERSGGDHVAGEGHAHVYVDGEKIARLYGPWLHIPSMSPGATVEVTLNANDHRPLAIGSGMIADGIEVPRD